MSRHPFFLSPKRQEPADPNDMYFQDAISLICALIKNTTLKDKQWKKITPTMTQIVDTLNNQNDTALERLFKIKSILVKPEGKGTDIISRLLEKKDDTVLDLGKVNFKAEKDIPALKQTSFFPDQRDILYYILINILKPLDLHIQATEDIYTRAYSGSPKEFMENALLSVANLKHLITNPLEMKSITKSLIDDMRKSANEHKSTGNKI